MVERLKSALDTLASICVIALAAMSIWLLLSVRASSGSKATRRPEPPVPASPVSLEGAAIKGNAEAKVGIVIYSDFQCPYCGKFARDTMPILEREYVLSERVFLAFRNLPLVTIHPLAARAAQAAACAKVEGRFWEMHDRLFGLAGPLSESAISVTATQAGLTGSQFQSCMSRADHPSVLGEVVEAKKLEITGTPTFLIGHRDGSSLRVVRRLGGAKEPDEFRAILNDLLQGVSRGPGPGL